MIMKTRLVRRIAAGVVATAFVLPMTACSKKKGKKIQKVQKDDPYFNAEKVEVDLNLDPDKEVEYSYISSTQMIGENVLAAYSISYKMPEELEQRLYSMDPMNEEEMQELMDLYSQYYVSGLSVLGLDGKVKAVVQTDMNSQITSFFEGKDGKVFALNDSYDVDAMEEVYSIVEVNLDDGTLGEAIPLKTEMTDLWGAQAMQDDDGNFIFVSYNGITVTDPNGKEIMSKEIEDFYGQIYKIDGKWYSAVVEHNDDYTEYKVFLQEIDLKTGEFKGQKTKIDTNLLWGTLTQTEDGCYMSDGNGVQKVDLLKNEKEEILNWNSTDVARTSGITVHVLSEDKIVFLQTEYEDDPVTGDWSETSYIVTLTRADENPNAGKTIIEIGANGIPSDAFLEYVVNYNTEEDNKARIHIRDFSTELDTTDYEKSQAELSDQIYLDMLAGTGPDVLVNFSSFSQFNSEEVLVDLNKYIDGKNGLNRDDYFDNVFRAFETKGKLYNIPVCVDINGLIGNKEIIGDRTGWTYSEFVEVMDNLPEDVTPYDQIQYLDLLELLLSCSTNYYIDYEKKQVNFESDEFKMLLDIAKKYGVEKVDTEMYDDDYYYDGPGMMDEGTKLDDGLVALEQSYVYRLDMYARDVERCDGNLIYVGAPSPDGAGMCASPMLTLAISAMSPCKDEAWDFISFMFTEDEQYEYSNSFYSIPLNCAAFDRINEDSIAQNKRELELREKYGDDEYYYGYNLVELTPEHAEGFRKLVESVSTISSTDPAVFLIVKEEAPAYFSGQRTVEDVCKNIQNRTTTIVNERG